MGLVHGQCCRHIVGLRVHSNKAGLAKTLEVYLQTEELCRAWGGENQTELGHSGFVYACFHTQYVNKLCSQVADVVHDINVSYTKNK